jgi:hypothetical protein
MKEEKRELTSSSLSGRWPRAEWRRGSRRQELGGVATQLWDCRRKSPVASLYERRQNNLKAGDPQLFLSASPPPLQRRCKLLPSAAVAAAAERHHSSILLVPAGRTTTHSRAQRCIPCLGFLAPTFGKLAVARPATRTSVGKAAGRRGSWRFTSHFLRWNSLDTDRMGNSTGQMFGVLFGWLIMSG